MQLEDAHREVRLLLVARRPEAIDAVLHELGGLGSHVALEVIDCEIAAAATVLDGRWDALLVDGGMEPDRLGATLARLRGVACVPLLVVLGPATIEAAVAAVRLGAVDYLVQGQLHRLAAVLGSVRSAADASDEAPCVVSDHMAEVGALSGAAAHEINNPLTVLIGNLDLVTAELAQLASSEPAIAKAQELADGLEDARKAAERIRVITADLRTFSSGPDAPRITTSPTDVRRLLDSALRLAWPKIRGRALLVKAYETSAARVNGQPAALAQLFYNLIVHAANGLPQGDSSENELRVAVRQDAVGRVLVEISETGRGWSATMVRRMVELFASPSPSLEAGMRLSVCRKVLSDVGARLEIASPPGGSCVFRIVFPRVRTDRMSDAPPLTPETSRLLN